MKSVMIINQTIAMTKNVKNISLEFSSGILFNPDKTTERQFFGDKDYVICQKPWIIVTSKLDVYSRIDEPIYILDNKTLYEHYSFKTLKYYLRRLEIFIQFRNLILPLIPL